MHPVAEALAGHVESGPEYVDSGRVVPPEETLERLRPLLPAFGITRVANITGLDRVGVPVVSIVRPNARSLAVAQGKGTTLSAAKVSGLMESIELYHAEHAELSLRLASVSELARTQATIDLAGLPVCEGCTLDPSRSFLWTQSWDLLSETTRLVPYELVHTDYRVPLPTASGALMTSSNGLASGNLPCEAVVHAICELIERDANTLWHLRGERESTQRCIAVNTIDDPRCQALLAHFAAADMVVRVWDTTSDSGVASFQCTVAERDADGLVAVRPVSGSACHPRKEVALLRALTEAAQGRLTLLSGAREDLFNPSYDAASAAAETRDFLDVCANNEPRGDFRQVPTLLRSTSAATLRDLLTALRRMSVAQACVVDLSSARFNIPVYRVIIPGLESMSEVPGFQPGQRARRALQTREL